MNAPLALALVLLASVVCGIALWPEPAVVVAAPRPAVVARVDVPTLPPASEAAVARAALAVMRAEHRAAAIVGERVGPDVLLTRHVPPAAIAVGRGVWCRELDAVARELLWRLLQHGAARFLGEHADGELQRLRGARFDAACFAWAGAPDAGAFYARLHGDDFVVEWVGLDDGGVHGAWRDFARDAGEPFLAQRVFGPAARR